LADLIPDSEWSIRSWLRSELPTVGVYFDPPKGGNVKFPLITIPGRIGGIPDVYLPFLDNPRISFQIWGGTGGGGRDQARQVMSLLAELLVTSENIPLDAQTYAYGATIDLVTWSPDDSDPDNVLARYVLDATLAVRSL
jgi:hypothetical protein